MASTEEQDVICLCWSIGSFCLCFFTACVSVYASGLEEGCIFDQAGLCWAVCAEPPSGLLIPAHADRPEEDRMFVWEMCREKKGCDTLTVITSESAAVVVGTACLNWINTNSCSFIQDRTQRGCFSPRGHCELLPLNACHGLVHEFMLLLTRFHNSGNKL